MGGGGSAPPGRGGGARPPGTGGGANDGGGGADDAGAAMPSSVPMAALSAGPRAAARADVSVWPDAAVAVASVTFSSTDHASNPASESGRLVSERRTPSSFGRIPGVAAERACS